jgi:uncharacterized protein YfaS (alpha-2-macroglobulin family)
VRLALEGPAQVTSSPDARVVATPGKPSVAWFSVAARGLGDVRARVTVHAGALSDERDLTCVVRPAAPLVTRSRTLALAAGESLSIDPSEGFIAGSARATLTVGGAPSVELRPALDQVVDYPYGCVEQTTSRALAMLRLPDLLVADGPDDARALQVARLVDLGIERLRTFETRQGGLSYWPEGREPCLAGTLYATAFLLEARRAGHAVDAQMLADIAGYLEREIAGGEGTALDLERRAEVARVLAGLDRPPLGWLARLSEDPASLGRAGRAHLAAAWLAAGRRDRALEAIAQDDAASIGASPAAERRPWWGSAVRADALLLDVLLDLAPGDARVGLLARRIESARRGGRWGNTLENATAIAALARYQATSKPAGPFDGSVSIGGGAPVVFTSAAPLSLAVARGAGPLAITSRGPGTIHFAIAAQGLDATGAAPLRDSQIRVRRAWLDREGRPLAGRSLRVGDLVRVEVTIDAPGLGYGGEIGDLAITDLLPGGLEVENPRLATSACAPGEALLDDNPERVEFGDDRVLIFTSAGARTRTFHYALRATAAGSFALAPIEASSMYDESVTSLAGPGRVEVSR